MGNVRFVIAAAVAFAGIGCASAPGRPAAPATEEIRFMKHRLVVKRDAAGTPTSAQAFDPNDKPVPTIIVPMGDVKVCPPQLPAEIGGGQAPECERFSFIPEGTSFKTGDNSICWYVSNGRLTYYRC